MQQRSVLQSCMYVAGACHGRRERTKQGCSDNSERRNNRWACRQIGRSAKEAQLAQHRKRRGAPAGSVQQAHQLLYQHIESNRAHAEQCHFHKTGAAQSAAHMLRYCTDGLFVTQVLKGCVSVSADLAAHPPGAQGAAQGMGSPTGQLAERQPLRGGNLWSCLIRGES